MGLKSFISSLFKKKPSGEMMRSEGGSYGGVYSLNSSKVNYEVARQLYNNTKDDYKLGSSFVKPIINSTVGFMGVPHFITEDENAQPILDDFILDNTSKMLRTHSNALKLGDCYIWITREEKENPLYPGDIPEGMEPGEIQNPWGFVPIVHFKNEPDETMKFGQSDIEPIEPLLKAYHDVMMHALKGSKMHSTPKLKIKLKDVAGFLRNNFGVEDPVKFAKDGGKVNLDGHEILFLTEGEDASFVEVNSATGDAQILLKLLFYCIVDVSETPEFIFGVHTPSALASVKEQMPIMVNKIRRKREQFTEQWQTLARMILIMSAKSVGANFTSYSVTLGWDEVNSKDDKELAETLEKVCNSLDKALSGNFISEEAAVNFLSKYIDTMSDYISDDPEIVGEREKIIKTKMLRYRLDDAGGLENEKEEIENEIGKVDKDE